MYSDKLAVAIKNNGKILREFKDTVYVPFGSEFSIFIKNLNSLRALVRISIDGTDIADGDEFVVNGNSTIEIERFLKSGNKERGNRFKFIERTKKIENGPRGIQAEDGLIRIEFEFEREPVPIKTYYYTSPTIWNTPLGGVYNCAGSNTSNAAFEREIKTSGVGDIDFSQCYGANSARGITASTSLSSNNLKTKGFSNTHVEPQAVVNDAGITVAGSISEQRFHTVSSFPTDGVKHVMVLKLLGEVGQVAVKEAITVKKKQKCSTCGHINKVTAKFCSECGTGLELV